jgi:putative FmdB family regulatory protein
MPLYEYVCPGCGESFEKRVPVAEADQMPCPHCGTPRTNRQLPRITLNLQNAHTIPVSASGGTCSSGSCCGGTCGFGDLD